MISWVIDLFVQYGFNAITAEIFARGVAMSSVILLSFVANIVANRFILAGVTRLILHTKTAWDDVLLKQKFFTRLAHLAPALVIYLLVPSVLEGFDRIITVLTSAALIYMVIILILVIDSFLNGASEIYQTFEIAKEIPIKAFVQVIKIFIYFIGGIFVVSVVMGKSPLYLFSGLGALTAIMMLIFKDAILGFVAGIQLAGNKMVTHGDWIEMPNYGADGDVVEVGLTTVKVRNWDKTITTIPTYALISESFKNWRGMSESGGRRIKRAIYIDLNSIRFCTEEMLERYKQIQYISDYIGRKRKELPEYNAARQVDDASWVNGRRLTNIGTFRAYTVAYLRNHPKINQNMTFLVRQLAPAEHGLPLEIYVFSNDIVWANYEAIQADIFDHLFAAVSEFDLRLFQNPSGSDFSTFTKGIPKIGD
ncbi:mechanosensitive ion channel [Nitrospira defluvii]|nr:mechanosensitive ion channel [Nitrospira defluvii]